MPSYDDAKLPAGKKSWRYKKHASTATDVSVTILTTLKEISQASGMIPYVGLAAALALEIVTAVQGAHDNKDSFKRLAYDVCSLVTNISVVCAQLAQTEGQKLSPMLNEHLKTLKESIKEFAQKHAGKAYWKRCFRAKSDKDRIQEFRERIRQALDVFGVQSHITVRESVVCMARRQQTFHEDLKESFVARRESLEPQSPGTSESRNPFTNRQSSSDSSAGSFDDAFKDILSSATITGNVTVNNIGGDSRVVVNNSRCLRRNVGNVVHTTTINSNNVIFVSKGL
ncbi:hypothetical protein L218DRAFT_857671 [Marasmius fiardii PR-910]|nr:hypothetical protein L218DRAFT_857671 [Marasmius fiardii PR-910]